MYTWCARRDPKLYLGETLALCKIFLIHSGEVDITKANTEAHMIFGYMSAFGPILVTVSFSISVLIYPTWSHFM